MKLRNPLCDLTKFELALWLTSVAVTLLSYLLSPEKDPLTVISSLIGVTALIFISKGYVLGQLIALVFAVFYGIISFGFRYYGEMITQLCISAPLALIALISWIRHPYKDTKEVEIRKLTRGAVFFLIISSAVVTVSFYFILRALGNTNLLLSTLSITLSYAAAYLTYCRSPYYAVLYSANDLAMISLWILAAVRDFSYFPMVLCFVMFLLNDVYGFYNWRRMEKSQSGV